MVGLAVGLACAVDVSAQDVIEDRVHCPDCQLTMTVEVRLGDADGPGAIWPEPVWIELDSHTRFWLVSATAQPMVFDSGGRFVQRVGRMGGGPGELRSPRRAVAIGDSVAIYDQAGRVVVFGPDLEASRTIRVPDPQIRGLVPLVWPDTAVADGLGRGPDLVGRPLHLMDFSGTTARALGSFDGGGGTHLSGASPRRLERRLAVAEGDAGLWAIDRVLRYRVVRWTGAGDLVAEFVRDADWFPEGGSGLAGGPEAPPSPRIVGIHEDADGLLWVVGHAAAPGWREAWAEAGIDDLMDGPVPAEIRPDMFPSASELYRTVVEVLDPVEGHVVLRESLDQDRYVTTLLADGRMVVQRTGEFDVPYLEIVRLGVSGSP